MSCSARGYNIYFIGLSAVIISLGTIRDIILILSNLLCEAKPGVSLYYSGIISLPIHSHHWDIKTLEIFGDERFIES